MIENPCLSCSGRTYDCTNHCHTLLAYLRDKAVCDEIQWLREAQTPAPNTVTASPDSLSRPGSMSSPTSSKTISLSRDDYEQFKVQLRREIEAQYAQKIGSTIQVPLTKEELTYLINDTIAYIWDIMKRTFGDPWAFSVMINDVAALSPEQQESLERQGYFERYELLQKLRHLKATYFPETASHS